jgi:DNA-binding NtrC family response regulator
VREGIFREDLFYRINTLQLCIPPLSEREEDIPGLVRHILMRMQYTRFPIDDSVIYALAKRLWPGNVRELRNTLDRALVLADGEPLTVEHLDDAFRYGYAPRPRAADPRPELAKPGAEYRPSHKSAWNLDYMEKTHVLRALRYFENNKAKTCESLGISQSALYRRLEKWQVEVT